MSGDVKALRQDFKEVKEAIAFQTTKYEEMCATMKTLLDEVKSLRFENLEMKQKQKDLLAENKELKERMSDLEQYQRRANIEIAGLPETDREDPYGLVVAAAKAVGVTLAPDDIDVCHRVPTKGKGPKPLICRLRRTKTRDEILDKARPLRGIPVATIIPALAQAAPTSGQPAKAYIGEHLTPELKHLYYLARKKKDDAGWKYAWIRGGRIFLRKEDQSTVVRVACEEDLARVK